MVRRMSKEEFKRFLDAVLSDDKVSEIVISFKYDNSIKFRWTPKEAEGGLVVVYILGSVKVNYEVAPHATS